MRGKPLIAPYGPFVFDHRNLFFTHRFLIHWNGNPPYRYHAIIAKNIAKASNPICREAVPRTPIIVAAAQRIKGHLIMTAIIIATTPKTMISIQLSCLTTPFSRPRKGGQKNEPNVFAGRLERRVRLVGSEPMPGFPWLLLFAFFPFSTNSFLTLSPKQQIL